MLSLLPSTGLAQPLTQRGFVEFRVTGFPEAPVNDQTRVIGDLVWRQEVFATPAPWIQLAAGVDGRLNTHDQVDVSWRMDVRDRTVLRPVLGLRRLSATLTRGPWTVDLGKQFIRWGKADIVTPTDWFAPRDYLNVVDGEFLPVTGARAVGEFSGNRLEVAFVPWLTPSRVPLLHQRWTVLPASIAVVDPATGQATMVPLGSLSDVSPAFTHKIQSGLRWGRTGPGYEFSLSFFDGNNTSPSVAVAPGLVPGNLDVARDHALLRSYGADVAVPLRWFTVKGETAWFTSPSLDTDEYVIYVVQIERQSGEWTFLGGYAGEAITAHGVDLSFAPDRGLTHALVARVSRTIDANRSATFETAIRQNGAGAYLKGEYSQAHGAHWRASVAGSWIGGDPEDFLGQYRKNSHIVASLRYSY